MRRIEDEGHAGTNQNLLNLPVSLCSVINYMNLSSFVLGKKVKHCLAFQRGRFEQDKAARNVNLGFQLACPGSHYVEYRHWQP